ncbi:MAG: Serine/threonine-protein kinase PknL [Chloroflexi bacterium ADurb.Bin360]|nr:MAG: Serine/threonine-protein kinase PknL [Chloroflexi bacterium ADurb.Bin360]
MEFLEGESLAGYITRVGSVPEAQVLTWALQLLDALNYCHSQGILHRDIKPQNVIITLDGKAVLVDFGLVKLWNPNDPLTRTVLRGMDTPEYAPPEQYGKQGQTTDPRSDIYSLGATLYHALTGQSPPTASDRIADPYLFQPVRALNPGGESHHRSSHFARPGAGTGWALAFGERDGDGVHRCSETEGRAPRCHTRATSSASTRAARERSWHGGDGTIRVTQEPRTVGLSGWSGNRDSAVALGMECARQSHSRNADRYCPDYSNRYRNADSHRYQITNTNCHHNSDAGGYGRTCSAA